VIREGKTKPPRDERSIVRELGIRTDPRRIVFDYSPGQMAVRRVAASTAWVLATALGCGWQDVVAVSRLDPADEAGDADATAPEAGDDGAIVESSTDSGAETSVPPPTAPCTAPGPYVEAWSFDGGLGPWSLSLDPGVQANLTWTTAVGDPTPGALQVDVTPAASDASDITGVYLKVEGLGDLAGRTAAAWVWLDQGKAPHLKMYAQTGSQYVWGDNGTVYLPARVWTCVSLPLSSSSYQQASYDPTDVIRLGFEMLGLTPFRLYVSNVHIQ
jgi:hypothetical protein